MVPGEEVISGSDMGGGTDLLEEVVDIQQIHDDPSTEAGLGVAGGSDLKYTGIDKVAKRLPAWKGTFSNRAGRLKLVNTVLSSMPVYFLTVFEPKQ